MNTTHDVQGISSVDFNKLLFKTIFAVAIGGFLALLVSLVVELPVFLASVVLWLATGSLSSWAQDSSIHSLVPIPLSRRLLYLLGSSIVGWTISFLLVNLLFPLMDVSGDSLISGSVVWIGVFAGLIIGLFPGLFISLAYWWLIRPDDLAKRLFIGNVIGWCLGMSLACASILLLISFMVRIAFFIFD
jgi:hypothetical protein